MDNPIQDEGELKELKSYEHCSGSIEAVDTNEETIMSTKDRDTTLTVIVLLLVCLGLAVLAHVIV